MALQAKKDSVQQSINERTKEVNEIIGGAAAVKYEVDWNSFSSEAQLNFVDNLSCHRINMAFRSLCIDDLAKDLVRQHLRTIKLHCVLDTSAVKQTFGAGIWEMWIAYGEGTNGMIGDGDMYRHLSASLHQNEARKLKNLKEETLPRRLQELDQILGGGTQHMVWDIDWASFQTEAALTFMEDACFQRLLPALRGAGNDDIAKGLCRKLIKKFVVKNVDDPAAAHYSFNRNTGVIEYFACFDRNKHSSGLWNYPEVEAYLRKEFRIAEAQRAQELQTRIVPERTKEFSDELGHPVNIDVDWSTFETFEDLNFIDNCLFHRMAMAFRCLPAPIKQAYAGKNVPASIHIKCISNKAAKKMSVEGQDLRFDCAFGSGLDGCFSDNEILTNLKTAW